ncbi:hypothetical protein SUGI_0284020 [Cryptomeria japonica]|uniref:probable glutathione S-transferase parA n=1 Tax=Cryptomeria japonica TaxID=3369 RepID=UPI002408D7A9|nr:probable glutathione S-transferase parA [Cryptomeria japonica]GLJ16587.1 hypothetical protein SUGI_0284020 [Cryptomeria japonica]
MVPQDENEEVKLLTYFASPFGMRVEQSLLLKGVNYENIQVNLREKSDIMLRSNPVFKNIPVLIHKGKPICESLIIVQYIDETWPASPRLLPLDPYERALARFWADFIDKQVFIIGREMILSTGEIHEKAKEKLKDSLETIDGTLKKLYEEQKGPLFGGENVNVVDLVLGPIVVSKRAYEAVGEYDLGGAEQLPNLFKWMEAFKASPAAAVLPHADKMKQIYVTVHNNFQASLGKIQARYIDDNGVVKSRYR